MNGRVPVGVSQCLLGEPVRYDGSHAHNAYLTEELGQHLDFRALCPEMAIGLGAPRPPIQLVATDQGVRARGVEQPSLDVTQPLQEQAERLVRTQPDLCGFIFMQRSPSCGLYQTKRFDSNGQWLDNAGRGAFAAHLTQRLPLLPVEESARLLEPALADSFLSRVFTLYDWKRTVVNNMSPGTLTAFYSRYKYLLMAHHVPSYQFVGRLLSDMGRERIGDKGHALITQMMQALARVPSRGNHINAMLHLRGYIRQHLSTAENATLDRAVTAYQQGEEPLETPLALLRQYVMATDNVYLKQQAYWTPHPKAQFLRSKIS